MGSSMTSTTNRGAWLHIAAFLDRFPNRPLEDHARRIGALAAQRTAEGAPLRGEVAVRVALSPSLPDGNHGENLNESQA